LPFLFTNQGVGNNGRMSFERISVLTEMLARTSRARPQPAPSTGAPVSGDLVKFRRAILQAGRQTVSRRRWEGGALLFECLSLGFRATSAPNKVTILLIFGNNSLNIREAVLLRSCTNAVPIVLP
jgi:hypothetical protein